MGYKKLQMWTWIHQNNAAISQRKKDLNAVKPFFKQRLWTNQLSISLEKKSHLSEMTNWDDDPLHANSPEQSVITTKAAIKMGDLHRMYSVLTSRSGCRWFPATNTHDLSWISPKEKPLRGGGSVPHSDSIPHDSLDPWIPLWLFHLSPETRKKRQADQHIYRCITGANTGVFRGLETESDKPVQRSNTSKPSVIVLLSQLFKGWDLVTFSSYSVRGMESDSHTQTHSPLNTGFSSRRGGQGTFHKSQL